MSSDIEQIPAISHSLEADMATGWKPKLKIIGPMPLNFDNPSIDKSIMALIHQESAFYQVVYLGPRPNSSFKLHELLAKRYRYKYSYLLHNDFAHLKPFFKKFYSLFEPEVKRPFHGMHPSITRRELIFDSCFEGGNLDCAVRLKANQYDLLLRVDSNTVGHVLWYHFRVTNPQNTSKIVRFNLCNLRKNKSAYERGMKPYVKRNGHDWQQQGDNLELNYQRLKYLKHNLTANMEQNQLNQPTFYRKLSFSLSLEPGQSIELAYCTPYSYSQLLQDLKDFKKKAQLLQGVQLDIDYEHESLSGLEIPIMKIHSGPTGNGKYCVFVIGRQHPGEANSSYVLRGAVDQILSGEELSKKLLRHCDFVVIPMVNPDGVVAGNFRTSLFGKDLNRLFKSKDTTLIPQIEMVRSVFTQQYSLYKKKLLLFLDYHGHSTRKNAFVLGPGIADAHLLNQIRILPKIMANSTQMFRYPSCSFRLDSNKKTTARALFGKFAGLSFTIQTSNWAYFSSVTKEVVLIQIKHLQELGAGLQRAIEEFVLSKLEAKGKYELRVKEQASKKLKMMKSRQELKSRKSVTSREKNQNSRANKQPRIYTESVIGERENNTHKLQKIIQERPSSVKEANSSDEMSQNGMDSESQAEDMENVKFKKYIKAASEMLVEFQMIYYGDLYNKGISKYKLNNNSKSNKLLFMSDKRKKIEPIQACLRQSERKPESTFKSEQQPREERPTRKKLFIEDSIFQKESQSRPKLETIHRQDNEIKKEGKRFKYMEPSRKGKINITSVIRGQNGLAQEMTHFQKIEFVNLVNHQRSLQRRKFEPSLEKRSPKSNIRIVVNRQKELNPGLPFIRGSKALLDDGQQQSNTSSSNNIGPKAKDRFTDLIVSEQLMNRSAVVNVLKLSRIQKEKSFKNP